MAGNEDNTTETENKTGESNHSGFQIKDLKLTQNFNALTGVKKRITLVQVRKPGPKEYVRVHSDPNYCLSTAVLDFKEMGETYLVAPDLWESLSNELIPKILYLTINRQKVVRIWPIRLPDEEGKLDDWNQSALEAAGLAKSSWVRVASNRSAGMYETFEAGGDLGDPAWPDMTFQEILDIAFKGKFIDDWDHPALKQLRGEI